LPIYTDLVGETVDWILAEDSEIYESGKILESRGDKGSGQGYNTGSQKPSSSVEKYWKAGVTKVLDRDIILVPKNLVVQGNRCL
jgi:hypothetical protein